MESLTERAAAMKGLLLEGYKEKLFADADVTTGAERRSEFAKLTCKQWVSKRHC
jgi:hypothetical protein